MKRSILMSLLVIGAVAAVISGATMAYFSDEETSSNNSFTAGTVDLVLKDADEDWSNGVTATWSSPNWAPGDDEVVAELRMKNIGTTGAAMVRVGGESLAEGGPVGPNNISDHIYVTTIAYTENGTYLYPNLIDYYTGIFGNGLPPLTLREFITSSYSMAFWIGACTSGPPPGPCNPAVDYLPANGAGVEKVKLGFTFESGAGNAYQGDWASFDIRVKADDDSTLLGVGGSAGYAE